MPLTPRTRLGPYEVLAPLGAGGMGEVYRARDTRLHRDVAVKVLPSWLGADGASGHGSDHESRVRRFEQEARALAALNHPHIVAIYDTGEEAGARYLVTELVEGHTLRRLLEPPGTRVPLRRALDYALQMAQALAAAHGRGILHRDLKPENVIIAPDGQVKVLDFGLARLLEPEATAAQASTGLGTNPGMVLGTPGYMAPEQVRGQTVDHRADVFAFGCVVYEMLAGQRAFRGETAADAMSAVLKDDPVELMQVSPEVPTTLGRIVARCLEKDPAARFQTAVDLAFALQSESVSTGPRAALDGVPAEPTPVKGREKVAWALAAMGLVASIAMAVSTTVWDVEDVAQPAMRTEVQLPGARSSFVSPDGRNLAYGNTEGVWLRRFDTAEPVRILREGGTEGVMCWSPDSKALAVNVKARLRAVSVPGGESTDLGPTAWIPTTCAWSPRGEVVFSSQLIPMLSIRVSDRSSRLLRRTLVAGEVGRYDVGEFLPDGRHFVFRASGQGVDSLYVGDLDDQQDPAALSETGQLGIPGYAHGHLLWVRDNALWARPLDATTYRFTGVATALAKAADRSGGNRRDFSTSHARNPTMTVDRQPSIVTTASLDVFDREGQFLRTLDPSITTFSLSPDGSTVAIGKSGGVWLTALSRVAPVRLTGTGNIFHGGVAWSRDAKAIYFTRNANARPALFRRALRPDAVDELLFDATAAASVNSQRVQPLDNTLLVRAIPRTPGASYDLMTLDAKGELHPWHQTDDNETGPSVSPDGRWVAFDSDAGGEWNVYVKAADGSTVPVRVSQAGGRNARWRGDGRELYFLASSAVLTAVPIDTGSGGLRFGAPVALFQRPHMLWYGDSPVLYPVFDVTPDGETFLMRVMRDAPETASFIYNWPALLKGPTP